MEKSQLVHGAFGWTELTTSDPAEAKKFYTELFGWTTKDWPMGEFTYTVINNGENGIGGLLPTPEPGVPVAWTPYVTVDDIDATAKKAEALGAKILVEPRDVPEVGRFAVFQDPQGAVIAAITYLQNE